ncbi:hypothetical protein Tco_0714307 [Tanacetum coccineum]
MDKSRSYLTHDKHQALFDALLNLLCLDDVITRGQAGLEKIIIKRDYDGDDKDEDPSARPNQGKKTKRKRTKELESSKKTSTTKETSKGNYPTKGLKSNKYMHAEDSVVKPNEEVIMNASNNDVVNDADQPQNDPAPKHNWFTQPPWPPTQDLEWNNGKAVDDSQEHTWFNDLLSTEKGPLTFDELMATSIDFSKFAINHLKIDKLIKAHLVGPIYILLKGTCQSDHCPFDLSKPLPLKGHLGHLAVASECFIKNGLEYLKSSYLEKKYTTSITKMKAASYESVGIKYMILSLWSEMKVEEIMMRKDDRKLYTFKEGDFVDLHLNDIEDMLLLAAQHKVEDVQLGVESYQKKLNITKPHKDFPRISVKELYMPLLDPPGVVYEDLNKKKIVMLADELYKFLDRTLKFVHDKLHHIILNFRLGYNKEMSRRKWSAIDKRRSECIVKLNDKKM